MIIWRNQKGLTPQELVFTLTVMMVLIGLVIFLINPPMRFKQAREAERFTDVDRITTAIRLHQVDNRGDNFIELDLLNPEKYYMVGTCESGAGTSCQAVQTEDECIDLHHLVDDEYLDDVPSDPKTGSREKTQYYLRNTATGHFIVGSCDPELSNSIKRSF